MIVLAIGLDGMTELVSYETGAILALRWKQTVVDLSDGKEEMLPCPWCKTEDARKHFFAQCSQWYPGREILPVGKVTNDNGK